MPSEPPTADWEQVLTAAAHLQRILPDAVLVGGTAAAIHVGHRLSTDADHVVTDLRQRFDAVLGDLESVAGWTTARVKRPVLILGSLDGIETGIRQLIRNAPLETSSVAVPGGMITLPTEAEMLRIKAVLILKRNATRDYLDFVALADHLGPAAVAAALKSFDALYPQPNGQSALQQLVVQLSPPIPYDLAETELSNYKNLSPRWQDWNAIKGVAIATAAVIFDDVMVAARSSVSEAP